MPRVRPMSTANPVMSLAGLRWKRSRPWLLPRTEDLPEIVNSACPEMTREINEEAAFQQGFRDQPLVSSQ